MNSRSILEHELGNKNMSSKNSLDTWINRPSDFNGHQKNPNIEILNSVSCRTLDVRHKQYRNSNFECSKQSFSWSCILDIRACLGFSASHLEFNQRTKNSAFANSVRTQSM